MDLQEFVWAHEYLRLCSDRSKGIGAMRDVELYRATGRASLTAGRR